MASLLELRSIVGPENAFGEASGIATTYGARFVVEPASVGELSEVLVLANRMHWSVAPCGSGSKMGWGNPPGAVDLLVRTRRMSAVLEHSAGDLVVSVEAGIELDALQRSLASSGQMLGLDPPEPGATVGGVIATNASGPLRLRYGTVRDLLIGIKVVLADGTVARAGGKVVKNVAGYDLGKLFTGSLGTLGIIAEATFRLHPRPTNQGALEVVTTEPLRAGEVVRRLLASALVPAAVELDWAPGDPLRLIVLFEGIAPGVEAQVGSAGTLLRDLAVCNPIGDELPAFWAGIAPRPWDVGAIGLKVTHPPGELAHVLTSIDNVSSRCGATAHVRGSAASGVLYLGAGVTDATAAAALVVELRASIHDGSVVVHEAPPEFGSALDVWGPVGGIDLMRRLKHEFDPAGLLNRGRFVGGI
jgi:glycolate oxidase FAD binding subunit